eukprot:Partr_v1_DN25334_c0_g1_i2_m21612 putative Conserved hypothetical protein
MNLETTAPSSSRISMVSPLDIISSLVSRRLRMISYIRNIHTGESFYFNTVMIANDQQEYLSAQARKRALQWFYLGISLGPILNTRTTTGFIRALTTLVDEYEYEVSDAGRQKFVQIFRKNKAKQELRADPYNGASSFLETGTYTYLMTPNVPFELDYTEVVHSLCDVLADIYSKLKSAPSMGSTTGILSQMNDNPQQQIINIGASGFNETLFAEAVIKVDSKLKKIYEIMVHEIDAMSTAIMESQLERVHGPLLTADSPDI